MATERLQREIRNNGVRGNSVRIHPYLCLLLAAVTLSYVFPARAAVLVTSGTSLAGATGVSVNSELYDVNFVEGTCASVYGSCDAAHFNFGTPIETYMAAQALLDQVFVGTYDTQAALTFGCAGAPECDVLIPVGSIFTIANNGFLEQDDVIVNDNLNASFDTTNNNQYVFAVFTRAGGVPEPTTWTMFLLGFAGIGFSMRRENARAASCA